jgi:hypothetical protein
MIQTGPDSADFCSWETATFSLTRMYSLLVEVRGRSERDRAIRQMNVRTRLEKTFMPDCEGAGDGRQPAHLHVWSAVC